MRPRKLKKKREKEVNIWKPCVLMGLTNSSGPLGWRVQERGRWKLGVLLEQWPGGGLRKEV